MAPDGLGSAGMGSDEIAQRLLGSLLRLCFGCILRCGFEIRLPKTAVQLGLGDGIGVGMGDGCFLEWIDIVSVACCGTLLVGYDCVSSYLVGHHFD